VHTLIGYGRESIDAVTLTHFDQGNEQSCTDSGEKDGQNASSRAKERSGLEKQWERGDNVSTEDLRVALQRYRSFFDRLLKF
jgi:hypothetical protein